MFDHVFDIYLAAEGVCFFFFKQKTAYEIEYGLVGSEMCIRDRHRGPCGGVRMRSARRSRAYREGTMRWLRPGSCTACLLYTSDAADERSSVDLGGRRIIKKKNAVNVTVVRVSRDIQEVES